MKNKMKMIFPIIILLTLPLIPVFAQRTTQDIHNMTQEQKNDELFRVVSSGNESNAERLRELLANGADPNSVVDNIFNYYGNSIAHSAAYRFNHAGRVFLPILAEAGCRFDVINENGITPLAYAGEHNRFNFKFILEWEQKNAPGFSGIYSTRKEYIASLFNNAFGSWEDSNGGDIEFIDNLIKTGEPIDGFDSMGRNLAWFVAGLGESNSSKEPYGAILLNRLIDEGWRFDIADNDGVTPLYRTLSLDKSFGDPRHECFFMVLEWEKEYSPDFSGGKTSRAEYLADILEKSINQFNNRTVSRLDVITSLLEAGADWRYLTEEKDGELFLKPRRGDRNINFYFYQALLDHGMPVDMKDDEGRTYLNKTSDTDIIQTLILDYGADPSIADNRGNTPLHRYYIEVRPLLVDAGADVNAKNNNGFTPLMRIVSFGSSRVYNEIVEFLELGADPLAKTPDGRNILHLYLENFTEGYTRDSPDPKVVKLLLDAGIDPADTDADGASALSLAVLISKKKDNKNSSQAEETLAMISAAANRKEMAQANINARQQRFEAYDFGERLKFSLLPLAGMGYLGLSIGLRDNPNNGWLRGINTFTSGFLIGTALAYTPFLLWALSEGGLDGIAPAIFGLLIAPAAGIITGIWWLKDSRFQNKFTYYTPPVITAAFSIPFFVITWMY